MKKIPNFEIWGNKKIANYKIDKSNIFANESKTGKNTKTNIINK